MIKRLQSYSSGGAQLLENSENYGALHLALLDAQCSLESRTSGAHSILANTATGDHGSVGIAAGASDTVAFGLVSGVFGAQCEQKMIPIGAMDDGLELWLTLDTFSNCFKLYQT